MKKTLIFYFFMLLLASGCNKCKKDILVSKDIQGMVVNDCNDSGIASVPVYFEVFNNGKIYSKIETTSGINGKFTFSNAQMHSSEKYSYAIDIPSKSGGISAGYTEVAFIGTTMYFSKDESDVFLKPHVTPGFLTYTTEYITAITNKQDSVRVLSEQRTYHKNKPDMPYQIPGGSYGDKSFYKDQTSHYPMGLYNIRIDIWKGGIHSTIYDSIYLAWGDTKTYTLNW